MIAGIMVIVSQGSVNENRMDSQPLLTEDSNSDFVTEHVIDIDDIPTSSSHLSLPNFGFWTSVRFLFNFSQITASAIVLLLSINGKPDTELLVWVVGYTVASVANLTLTYLGHLQRNQITNDTSTVSDDQLVDRLMFVLWFFFTAWFFVAGAIWVVPGYSSISESSVVYRLSFAYMILSCGGYFIPFVICPMMNCLLPIIFIPYIYEGDDQIQAADEESINALPTHKFKSKRNEIGSSAEANEDSVCSICLASYVEDDELREMPCSHYFHSKCVDRWLRIKASCPLCKYAIVEGK